MVEEATLTGPSGQLTPDGAGWFVVNLDSCRWLESETFGAVATFEGGVRFDKMGVNVRILQPGQPASLYHAETHPEAFLVLSGRCTLVVEEQERELRAWDFVHCPPRTRHVLVGAGEAPCAILMMGTRGKDKGLSYPVSEAAARHGASVSEPTDDPSVAYAGRSRPEPIQNPWRAFTAGAAQPAQPPTD